MRYGFCYVIDFVSMSRTSEAYSSTLFSPSTQYTAVEYTLALATIIVVLFVYFSLFESSVAPFKN
jgi:hypothetical protein